jgi:hypothetical protein
VKRATGPRVVGARIKKNNFAYMYLFGKYIEDIQCFLMNIEFISRVRQDFKYLHECEA